MEYKHQCCICEQDFPCTKCTSEHCTDYEEVDREGIRFYCPFCWIDDTLIEETSHRKRRRSRKPQQTGSSQMSGGIQDLD